MDCIHWKLRCLWTCFLLEIGLGESSRSLCVIGGRRILDPAWFEGGTKPWVFFGGKWYRGRSYIVISLSISIRMCVFYCGVICFCIYLYWTSIDCGVTWFYAGFMKLRWCRWVSSFDGLVALRLLWWSAQTPQMVFSFSSRKPRVECRTWIICFLHRYIEIMLWPPKMPEDANMEFSRTCNS